MEREKKCERKEQFSHGVTRALHTQFSAKNTHQNCHTSVAPAFESCDTRSSHRSTACEIGYPCWHRSLFDRRNDTKTLLIISAALYFPQCRLFEGPTLPSPIDFFCVRPTAAIRRPRETEVSTIFERSDCVATRETPSPCLYCFQSELPTRTHRHL